MTFEFELLGSIPSKKNSKKIVKIRGRSALVSSDEYRLWEQMAIYQLRLAYSGDVIKKAKVSLDFEYSTKRRKDLTNSAEGVMDALVCAGILADDCWAVVPMVCLSGRLGSVDVCRVKIEVLE